MFNYTKDYYYYYYLIEQQLIWNIKPENIQRETGRKKKERKKCHEDILIRIENIKFDIKLAFDFFLATRKKKRLKQN